MRSGVRYRWHFRDWSKLSGYRILKQMFFVAGSLVSTIPAAPQPRPIIFSSLNISNTALIATSPARH